MSERLWHLAHRVADDPTFIGYALARYQAQHHLDRLALAAWLGMSDPDNLASLALCKLPRPDHYAADLARIATRVGADPDPLAHILYSTKENRA